MADAGFRLTVEGEREFKDALAAADAAVKRSTDQIKLLTEQYRLSDDGMDGLMEKQKVLEKAYAGQTEKVKLLEAQYAKMAESTDRNAAGMVSLEKDVSKARLELAKMTNAVQENQQQIDAARESAEKFQAGLEEYQENTRRLDEYISELNAGMDENGDRLDALAEEYDRLGGSSKELREKQKNLNEQNELLSDQMNKQQRVIETLNRELKNAEDLYGKNSKEAEDYRKQIDKAADELADMKVQMDKNNDAMKNAADEGGNALYETLEKVLDITGVEIPDGIKNMIKGFDDSAVAVAGITGALVGVAGKVAEIFAETIGWADELTRKSQVMGIDTGTYQALEYAASNLGIEMDAIDDALNEISLKATEAMDAVEEYYTETERLKQEATQKKQELLDNYLANQPKADDVETLAELEEMIAEHERKYAESLKKIEDEYRESMDELRKNTDEAIEVFDQLGVNIDDGTGKIRPIIDIFYDVVDALNETGQPAERLEKAVDLLGEEARQLNPLFDAGAESLHTYAQEARDLGIIMDEEMVDKFDEAARKVDALSERFNAAVRNILADTFSLEGLWENTPLGGFISTWITGKDNYSKFFKTVFGIPANAYGTYNHIGGYTLVGERGPEIVDLPRGSKVYPNGEIPDGMGGTVNYINVTIPASDIREFNDIVRIVQSQRQSIRGGYVGR